MGQKRKTASKGRGRQLSELEEGAIIKHVMQSLGGQYPGHHGRGRRAERIIGYQLGTDLAWRFSSSELGGVVEEFSDFWKQSGIGFVFWHDKENKELIIKRGPPDSIGKSLGLDSEMCPLKEGLLEALIEKRTKLHVDVKEIECSEKQAPQCIFKILVK